jgi:hypothetical protein
MRVKAEVQNDHLEKLASARNPILAVAELVWNALDADASQVSVNLIRNNLEDIEAIRVVDNGHGIEHLEALDAFKKLGSSWKKNRKRSRGEGRILHGQDGQGRYKAFALGDKVKWTSRYPANGNTKSIIITGQRPDLTDFDVSDPIDARETSTGTTVEVSGFSKQFRALDDASQVACELALRFALYLREYPNVTITFDQEPVDHRKAEERYAEYPLGSVTFQDGTTHDVKLAIIEWKIPVERALYFCDSDGFVLEKRAPGIHAPEFTFTAYVRSSAVRQLENRAAFAFEEGHPDLDAVSEIARNGMKRHFLARRAELAEGLVEAWKAEKVYPFEGEPTTSVEIVERQVFDVVAKNVRDYLPSFDTGDAKSKRFSFRLLRRAIESSPDQVQQIIKEVLELPEDKAADLANLLHRTSLAAIINATTVVADRLDFVTGLRLLLYEEKSKKALKERSQLQKILEDETWIFGEQFALTVADQSLNEVLIKHLEMLGRSPGEDFESEVVRPDGSRGIVDLMLAREIPQPDPLLREYLIIELKRPSQKINAKIIEQIKSYAIAVAEDERFRDTKTRWIFWAIANDVVPESRRSLTQRDRPFGLIHDDVELNLRVWAKPWSTIIDDCRARMNFYKKGLEYDASNESALGYLQKVYDKYLPTILKTETEKKGA